MTRGGTSSVSPDVLTAHLEGEVVLLHLGSKQYFRLNETGAAIWKALERGVAEADIVVELTREFDVDADTAAVELRRTLSELTARGLLAS
jgi:hypothetical protein